MLRLFLIFVLRCIHFMFSLSDYKERRWVKVEDSSAPCAGNFFEISISGEKWFHCRFWNINYRELQERLRFDFWGVWYRSKDLVVSSKKTQWKCPSEINSFRNIKQFMTIFVSSYSLYLCGTLAQSLEVWREGGGYF